MNRHARFWLLLFAASAPAAMAQQTSALLNETELAGRQVLAQNCGVCHLQPSKGSVTYGPMLNRASGAGNAEVVRTVIINGTDRMPAFRWQLKPAEIDAVVAYLKTVPAPATVANNEASKGGTR